MDLWLLTLAIKEEWQVILKQLTVGKWGGVSVMPYLGILKD